VVLIFIYLFYKNYIAITTTVSTKQLMRDILKTRKTVQFYVWYNLGMIVLYCIIGFTIAFTYNPDVNILREKIVNDGKIMAMTIGILLLTIVLLFGIFWLFYRLLYGILLRRLHANYKELKKIDL
jgi:ABC-type multidrug transport system fused ATPase/permease subunit